LIKVKKITESDLLETVFKIRKTVFVEEQQVKASDEFDTYEESSHHFLAYYNGIPCGAARWRITKQGVKLERFAVLIPYRNKGVGSALVKAVLDDVKSFPDHRERLIYLHSQLSAIPLYKKHGFRICGSLFKECNIEHYKMIKK